VQATCVEVKVTSTPSQSKFLMELPVTICMLSPPSPSEDPGLQHGFLRARHQMLEVRNLFQTA